MSYPQNGGRIVAMCDATSPRVLLFTKRVGDGNDVCWLPSDVLTPAAAATVHLNSCGCVGVWVCVCVWRARHKKPGDSTRQQTDKQTDRQTDRPRRTNRDGERRRQIEGGLY